MAKAPHHRSAARRPPRETDEVIELATGDIEADPFHIEVEDESTAVKLPPTKILPHDPQRAVATSVYGPEHLEAPPSAETHVFDLPEEEEETTQSTKPPPPVAEPALEPALLLVEKGPGAGTSIPVLDGELTIGRSSANGLSLPLPSVSRHHATLIRQGERFFVQDEGSHNGTYLNGRKISGQAEMHSGDEISLGKAVLLLRSAATEPGLATSTSPVPERPWAKVAIFGGAMLIGLVTVLVFASTRSSAPAPAEPPPAVATRAEPVRPPPAEPVPIPVPEPRPKPDISLVGDTEISAARVFEQAQDEGEEPEIDAARPEKKPRKKKRRGKRRRAPSAGADSPEARALYESGDLDGALALARRAGASELAGQIGSFKKELAAAKADLSFKDGAGAIRHFMAALRIDDELSDGWSRHGGEIRQQLSRLYELAGLKEIDRGDHPKAAALLERALKYDPSNAKAKEFLRKVRATPTGAAHSAADEAFGN